MRQTALLKIASVLAVLLLSLHLADDIVRGFERGGISNLLAVPILVAWLSAALLPVARRWGDVVVLLASLLGTFVPVVHFGAAGGVTGHGVSGAPGALLWVWTLVALGVASAFSALLAALGLWRLGRGRANGAAGRRPAPEPAEGSPRSG